ncbi:MAG TPA: DUF721 domain-containing protein [Leucothrix mucor]|nr:DUF721 domain-containing protein [Leucothrix mucor]
MKKLTSLVNNELTRSINIYDKLSKSVYELLELNKNTHNIWVVVKQQQLTLVTDHPILASQLQFQQDKIRDHLNKTFLLQLKKTQIKIAPPKAFRQIKKEKIFEISEGTANVLHEIANMIDDEEVRDSLKKLTK